MNEKTTIVNSRKKALAAGDMFFETGTPCHNGHISVRYASNGHCKACALEKAKTYGKTDKAREASRRHNKKYHACHKDDPMYLAKKRKVANDYYNKRKHDPEFIEMRRQRTETLVRKIAKLDDE